MIEYLLETHAHTSEVSPCSHVDATTLVELYIEKGYSGVVITNHFCEGIFKENSSWEEKVEHFLSGWKIAKLAAINDFTVLLGMELRLKENYNEYLVYGIDEEFLFNNENLLNLSIKEFMALAKENGLIVFQAHPFRNGVTIINPSLVDGIEVYNGNIRHDSRNDIAENWAQIYGLYKISGSDFHELYDVLRGGIITKEKITNNSELLNALRNHVKLLKN